MYTLFIGKDNYIVTISPERIIQRSKLVNTVCIRVANDYNGLKMQDFQAIMYYRLPVSKEWKPKELFASEELYKDEFVEYLIPVDTWLTAEAGDVEFEIKFYNVSMGGDINISQYVRKATNGKIHISHSKDWADGIADSLLDTIDQRIIQLMMVQNRQEEMIEETQSSCASSLLVEDSKLYLVDATGNKKGEPADIVVPRVSDDQDGSNDNLIDLDNKAEETTGNEEMDGNFFDVG